jgi:hypothetical protein
MANIFHARNPRGATGMDTGVPCSEAVIVQDVWHARERINRLLSKRHPQHRSAERDLKQVFSRLVSKVMAKQ